jgi:hypothetical protein
MILDIFWPFGFRCHIMKLLSTTFFHCLKNIQRSIMKTILLILVLLTGLFYFSWAQASNEGKECSNDFSCGIGYTCVKKNYSNTGYCAKSVDKFGVQQFELPRLDSVGPKLPSDNDCTFDTDCPLGFKCDRKSGACFKK